MFTDVKYLYSESAQYATPVFIQDMPRAVFMRYVREGVEKLFSRTESTLRNYRMYANILEQYLIQYEIHNIQPKESFIKEMWDRLKESGQFSERSYEWATRKKVPRFTRQVVNEHFLPSKLAQRKLVKEIAIQRYERLFKLSENSQQAIKWFEQNGKRVEAKFVIVQNGDTEINPNNQMIRTIHQITNRLLLPLTKSGKITHAIRFLEFVNKNGFEEATNEDVEKFKEVCVQRGVKQIDDYLAHVATFFINIHSKGFIKSNPFANVSLKMNGGAVKKDFITVEGMGKLRDLKTLDRTNKIEVRDRLFALLGYDLAIRIGELLSLKVSDFKKDENGEWFVLLRSEVQKGSNKDAEMMYFFFDETKEILELYLNKIRNQFRPTTDFLILSNQWGKALSAPPCATRFKELCKKFEITTYHGDSPSPHLLRHSFATLNIEPIGLSIPLYEMSQRLRHTRVETTRKHYIHNNPYLKKIKHDVLRKNGKKKKTADILNEMPLAEIEHWLSDKLGMESSMIRQVRVNHKKVFSEASEAQVDKKVVPDRMLISEGEALERVKDLQISPLSLRKYARKKSLLSGGLRGSFRYGKDFQYREDFIDDLIQNWVTVDYLCQKIRVKGRMFYRVLEKEKWRTLKIGRTLLINKHDCI